MATVAFQPPPARLCDRHRPSSSSPSSPSCRLLLRSRQSLVRCFAAAEAVPAGGDNAGEERSGNGTNTATADPPQESAVGTSKRTSSLISAENVQKALRGIAITDVDHYGRLGIARSTSYAEVNNAYKRKCEELMSQDLDEDEISQKMDLLKESYAILSSEEERRLYDWSLSRSEKPDRYVWPFEVDITQTPTQPPPPQEPEDVGPTRLVGYFFLAWIILSFALSVTLNR